MKYLLVNLGSLVADNFDPVEKLAKAGLGKLAFLVEEIAFGNQNQLEQFTEAFQGFPDMGQGQDGMGQHFPASAEDFLNNGGGNLAVGNIYCCFDHRKYKAFCAETIEFEIAFFGLQQAGAQVGRCGKVRKKHGKTGFGEFEKMLALPEGVVGIQAKGGEIAHWTYQAELDSLVGDGLPRNNGFDVTIKSILDGYRMGGVDHKSEGRAGSLTLVAENLALNFANTESGRGGKHHLNHLKSASDVLTWARHADVIADSAAQQGCKLIKEKGAIAERMFQGAVSLRSAIYDINAAFVAGRKPGETSLKALIAEHRETLRNAKLLQQGTRYGWSWNPDDDLAAAILGPIAEAAINLLTQQDRSRIKQCKGMHCGWLFLDTTKNNSRCWCDMRVCGNRSKIKAMRMRNRHANLSQYRLVP